MYIKLFEDSTQRRVLTTKDMVRAITDLKDRIDPRDNIYIDISGNSIPADSMKILAQYLSSLKLAGLKMYDIMASLHHLEAYASLAVFTKYITTGSLNELKELDVSDNAFGESGLRSLESLLSMTLPNLKILNLGNIGFSKEACSFLRKTYFNRKEEEATFPLETFICDNNYLSDQGCNDLVAILGRCPFIKHLQISASRISTEGIQLITPVIRQLKKLESINLADTYFNDETFQELIDSINQHTVTLDELNLAMTSIELHQLEILFSLKLEQIKILDISYNAIEWFDEENKEEQEEQHKDKAISVLIAFLEKYKVEELKIDGCNIETDQVVELISGFKGKTVSVTECYSIMYKGEHIEQIIDSISKKNHSFEVFIDESQFMQIEDFEDYFKIAKANKKVGDELVLKLLNDEKYKLEYIPGLRINDESNSAEREDKRPDSDKITELESGISEVKL